MNIQKEEDEDSNKMMNMIIIFQIFIFKKIKKINLSDKRTYMCVL
jgi:hypothetical protein